MRRAFEQRAERVSRGPLQLTDRSLVSKEAPLNSLALTLNPTPFGWAVRLTDGRELARFIGPGARRRAERYLTTVDLAQGDGNVC
jgi:hypothetical protein